MSLVTEMWNQTIRVGGNLSCANMDMLFLSWEESSKDKKG